MRAIDLIKQQLNTVKYLLYDTVNEITDSEWTARAIPGTSLPGTILFHLPRIQDCAVQTFIRGVPEVITTEPWASRIKLPPLETGIGIPLEEADKIAYAVSRQDLLEYAGAVHKTIEEWLDSVQEEELEIVPDVEAHLAPFPIYQNPKFRMETAGMFNRPAWRLLVGPCVGHLRGHFGELEVLLQVIREGTGH